MQKLCIRMKLWTDLKEAAEEFSSYEILDSLEMYACCHDIRLDKERVTRIEVP